MIQPMQDAQTSSGAVLAEPSSAGDDGGGGGGGGGEGGDRSGWNRRQFLAAASATVATGLGAKLAWDTNEAWLRAQVFVARAADYSANLRQVIADGLAHLGLPKDWARGKTVLLKPNLVEPTRAEPQINTHPAMVQAAAEVFRAQGARAVIVAEGQGHIRDTDLVLEQSGLGPALKDLRAEFIDLNHDDLISRPNRAGLTKLSRLILPATLDRVDLIVSMPKMKTHHWAGVTLSMKNLFGVMPSMYYGWPKNVLHHAGIPHSIVDITASVLPHLAIVDGIVGMEGDGPIMGTAKPAGLIVLGTNLPAVDATCARLMDIIPERVPYLAFSSGWLGPILEAHIEQRGEPIATHKQRFQLIDMEAFRGLRDS